MNGAAPSSRVDSIRRNLVMLKMPRALEILDATLRRIEQGQIDGIEALDDLLGEELSLRSNPVVRHLMTMPGVGAVTALGFVATIDDPSRFRRTASAGAYLGLTPKIYASGETKNVGRISRRATTSGVRSTRRPTPCSRERHGRRHSSVATRSGLRRAKVAVACKLRGCAPRDVALGRRLPLVCEHTAAAGGVRGWQTDRSSEIV